MKRRKSAFFVLMSLLACIFFAGLFVRSFWIADEVECHRYFADRVVATRRSIFVRTDYGSTYIAYRLLSGPTTPAAIPQRTDFIWQADVAGLQASWLFKPPAPLRFTWQAPWTVWRRPGFLIAQTPGAVGAGGYHQRAVIISFPTPIAVGMTALLPLIYLARRWRRLNRTRQGRCPACSYILTGNTSGFCPECGEPAESPAAGPTNSTPA